MRCSLWESVSRGILSGSSAPQTGSGSPVCLFFVIFDICNMLFPSLVNLSTVNSFHIFQTPQFPFALPYCFRLCFLSPLLVSRSGSLNLSIYVSCIRSISRELRLLSPTCPNSSTLLFLPLSTRFHIPWIPEIPESGIPTLPRTQKSGIPEGFHREQGNTLSLPQ